MTYEVVSGKFTAYLMTGKPGDPATTTIPKGSRIVLVESGNPDHIEFTIGPDRYWFFKSRWNEAYLRAMT